MRELIALIFIFSFAVTLFSEAEAQQVSVEANKSVAVSIRNGDAASVVIGNPNIADVSVHNSNLLFITGRTFGTTNLLVYDAEGRRLYSGDVAVTTSTASILTVNRAGENHTFDCAPNCRPILAIGDEEGYFTRNFQQNQQLQQLNAAE
ncbi:MAG: pilus assembly protein N-terminal domain-containing protein [Pseudomonadota bacterium]